MGFIYIIRCTLTLLVYIGQTVNTIEHRWDQHNKCAKRLIKHKELKLEVNDIQFSRLYNAMAYYGPEHFTIEMIDEVPDAQLNDAEIKYIQQFDCISPKGYNLTSGGDSNYRHAPETIELMKLRKRAKVDAYRNEKLYGLPALTAYRNHPVKGESIRVHDHPLCKNRTFSVKTFGSYDAVRKAVIEFMTELERSNVAYVPAKKGDVKIKGIQQIDGGWRVNKVINGRTFDRKFDSAKHTPDEHLIAAKEYLAKLLETYPKKKKVQRLNVSGADSQK